MSGTYVLGIDLGTSAVKGILRGADGQTWKEKRTYGGTTPQHWLDAMASLIAALRSHVTGEIAAVGFSSQVGTYVIDGKHIISWRDDAGREELDAILAAIPQERFLREIGMYHPHLVSYPLPRYLYIQKHFGAGCEVLMPKELLIRELTGQTVTDVYSMRGLADLTRGVYAEGLLRDLGIGIVPPELKQPTDMAGRVTVRAAEKYGLPAGTPVYLGTSDFFAGLLGMGVSKVGDAFDLSGTSEHVGYLSEHVLREGFISGKYFFANCTYGVTGSSGASCDLAVRHLGIDSADEHRLLSGRPPIFLPYLGGERAPIFDGHARGVYFGLGLESDREQMAYAALEGVVFSLYHIAECIRAPRPERLICGGGSAVNPLMNRLRATLFDCDTVSVCDHDTSALGACMLAMTGCGMVNDLKQAIGRCVAYRPPVHPTAAHREVLLERFEIYKKLYGDLRERFREFTSYETIKENIL